VNVRPLKRRRRARVDDLPGGGAVAGERSARPAPAGVVPPDTVPLGDLSTILDEDTATDLPWLVIVWNDPINLMSYVTFVLQKLFGYSKEKATTLMLDVHHKGRAVVSSGSRERAELDVYRLHEHGLWATMEQSG